MSKCLRNAGCVVVLSTLFVSVAMPGQASANPIKSLFKCASKTECRAAIVEGLRRLAKRSGSKTDPIMETVDNQHEHLLSEIRRAKLRGQLDRLEARLLKEHALTKQVRNEIQAIRYDLSK